MKQMLLGEQDEGEEISEEALYEIINITYKKFSNDYIAWYEK